MRHVFLMLVMSAFFSSANAFERKLLASDSQEGDRFGHSVAVSGEWMAVGAPYEDGISGTPANIGTVYLYRRNGTEWVEEQILRGGASSTFFGFSVALTITSGTPILVVSDAGDGQKGFQAGAVQVYTYGDFCRSGMCWAKKAAKLIGSEVGVADLFGWSVDIDNERIAIGAALDEAPGGTPDTGAVYIFKCATWLSEPDTYCSSWLQEKQLVESNGGGAGNDSFGHAVAIDGDTVAIGARLDDNRAGMDAGAVYLFRRGQVDGSGFVNDWALEEKIDGVAVGSRLGESVDLSGDKLVAGAAWWNNESGTAVVYRRDTGSVWSQRTLLLPRLADHLTRDVSAGQHFGISVSFVKEQYPGTSEEILVGADWSGKGINGAGAAHLFQSLSGSWKETDGKQIARHVPSDGADDDYFGAAVARVGGISVVGANSNNGCADDVGCSDTGAVYVFHEPISTSIELKLGTHSLLSGGTTGSTSAVLGIINVVGPHDDLAAQQITLEFTDPNGIVRSEQPQGKTNTSGYVNFSAATMPNFDVPGTWAVRAYLAPGLKLASSSSLMQYLTVATHAGYAVIVEGSLDAAGSPEERSTNKSAKRLYQTLLARGFAKEHIYYFSQDKTRQGVDALPTQANLKQQLVSNIRGDRFNSLLENASARPAPIHIFLLGPAEKGGRFYLNPDQFSAKAPEILTAGLLDNWLDILEADPNIAAWPRTVVIDSPWSGGFIPGLSASSNVAGRVLVSSAAASDMAFKGAEEKDGVAPAAGFLGELLNEWSRGLDLRHSFATAARRIQTNTRADDRSLVRKQQFIDNQLQRPLLDDNADKAGSMHLTDGTTNGVVNDGAIARSIYLGYGNDVAANGFIPPATQFLPGPTKACLDIIVPMRRTAHDRRDAWTLAVRLPESRLVSAPDQARPQSLPYLHLDMKDTSGGAGNRFQSCMDFSKPGKYEVWYWGETKGSGKSTRLKRSVVYVNKAGNQPPSRVTPINPENGASDTSTSPYLRWESVSDSDGDALTYTVRIASSRKIDRNGMLMDTVYEKEEVETSFLASNPNLLPFQTYFWQVTAVDSFGGVGLGDLSSFNSGGGVSYAIFITVRGTVRSTGGTAKLKGTTVSWTPTDVNSESQNAVLEAINEGGSVVGYRFFFGSIVSSKTPLCSNGGVQAIATDFLNSASIGREVCSGDKDFGESIDFVLAINEDPDGDGLSSIDEDLNVGTEPDEWDTDGDGVGDGMDAFPLDETETTDSDGDGVGNNSDNCLEVINPGQEDSNSDGFGNHCDPDLNGDLKIDFADLAILKSAFFRSPVDIDADLNVDNRVDFADLAIMNAMFFRLPGPSALAP